MPNETKPNQVATTEKPKFSVAIRTDAIQTLITRTLGDPKRTARFTASISSVVATNPALQECDPNSVITSALVGEALELPPSPQLGYFYMVPFDNKNRGKLATFILGYKGYIQLAIRSGLYSDIDAMEVRQGEYLGKDPETGRPRFRFIEDDEQREQLPVVGYLAYLELKTGFKKVLYWPSAKMLTHADTYSKAFSAKAYQDFKNGKINKADEWKYSSFWYKQFDEMAKKTMLRQLISKFGIMSVEIQTAFENDNTFQDENGNRVYADKDPESVVETVKADSKIVTGNTQPPVVKEEPKPIVTDEQADKAFQSEQLEGQQSLPIDKEERPF